MKEREAKRLETARMNVNKKGMGRVGPAAVVVASGSSRGEV